MSLASEHFSDEFGPELCSNSLCTNPVFVISLKGIGSRGEAPGGTYYCQGQNALETRYKYYCSLKCVKSEDKSSEDLVYLQPVDFDGCRVGGLKACDRCDCSAECHGSCLQRLWEEGVEAFYPELNGSESDSEDDQESSSS